MKDIEIIKSIVNAVVQNKDMDTIDNMLKDRALLNQYINKIKDDIPIFYIDASCDEDSVTCQIDHILSNYTYDVMYLCW